MSDGIIIKGIGGFYYVLVNSEIYECRARGRFRKDSITPMVGDYVKISIDSQWIEEILPRKNQLIRPQVANIDNLAIVVACSDPAPDFLLLDKLLVYAHHNSIRPIIIINKIDLSDELSIASIIDMYKPAGYSILTTSCEENIGLEHVRCCLDNGITAFAGQSGVGKSSLINSLCPHFSLKTGDISQKVRRGRHTTRYVELLPLPYGGMIVDTPGFSSISLLNIEYAQLQYYYPEFVNFIGRCRFSGCIHYHEPDCIVKEQIGKTISKERYGRYIKLLQEIKGV